MRRDMGRAQDGIGATCKRTADQLIAQRGDITNLYDFVAVLRRCPNIQISVIEDVDIEKVNRSQGTREEQKAFKGTLLVHQVLGHIYDPNIYVEITKLLL
ncbi:hypothetical protein EVAR_76560_1 [Eumeta japonica]|uniref:Uncharacterized protein n=1 Tax=Eumeta variegata TaxID=151549 RepID=A0A4C1T5T1_EUMVA|nr:hypothetical protein EVAR_76560_1 [Eumeta japonica]